MGNLPQNLFTVIETVACDRNYYHISRQLELVFVASIIIHKPRYVYIARGLEFLLWAIQCVLEQRLGRGDYAHLTDDYYLPYFPKAIC
jgi:hypothetical protein